MLHSSLRNWLLVVAILFSVIVVGGMALTTYVVVFDGLNAMADDSVRHLADVASHIAQDAATQARSEASTTAGAEDPERVARRVFLESVPEIFGSPGFSDGDFAFYDEGGRVVWYSRTSAVLPQFKQQREMALAISEAIEDHTRGSALIGSLVGPTDLGIHVIHLPVDVPGGGSGVLDISYSPTQEERVIDAIRPPMTALAVAAMIIMVLMMQVSMVWVLKLVDDLRKAADSIAAGHLDVRLPAEGDHEISALARSINGAIEHIKRRGDAQTRFVADASHELATPVAGIRGYTNILRAWGAEDPELREEAISAIDRESRRMARLCSNLLSLLRNERGLAMRHVRYDINAICRHTLAAAATRYINKRLDFSGPEEGQLMMVGDPDRIEDVISILVDNAAKYTHLGGSVSVRTRRRRGAIFVEVQDTGIGIPEHDIDSIFDRFYRSDASRCTQTGGAGLGLSIAKTIIEAADGEIQVHSVEGQGTTFTLRLPRGRL
ncbi:MAG: sensor histidine kinase [Coriobacteriia bacterium]